MRTLLRIIIRAIAAMPSGFRSTLGFCGGALFSFVPTRDRRIAALQVRRFLGGAAPYGTVLRAYGEAGRTALLALRLQPLLPRVRPSNEALINELARADRPVLALTAHLGIWDLLGAFAVARGFNVATIGRAARSPALHDVLSSIRAGYGITTLWRDESDSVRALVRHFRANGLIAALIDQDTRVASIPSPFFGLPAHTPATLVELARRCGARVVTAFIHREPSGEFIIDVEPIPEAASTQETIDLFNARLEALVRRFPAQWVWFHKRWRTQPNGERLSSRAYERWLKESVYAD